MQVNTFFIQLKFVCVRAIVCAHYHSLHIYYIPYQYEAISQSGSHFLTRGTINVHCVDSAQIPYTADFLMRAPEKKL